MGKFKLAIITITGVLLVGLLGIFMLNGFQNKAIGLEEQIKVADSDIKVQEKRRVDLINNLVDTIKEYDKHEANTLKDIVEARGNNQNVNDIENVSTMLSVVVESYPELKSNENYKELMNELSVTENLIAQFRTNYNNQIKEYNRYVRKFPNKQILSLLGYEYIDYNYLNYNAPVDAPQNLFGE